MSRRNKNRLNSFTERIWHFKRDKNLKTFLNISRGIARLIVPSKIEINIPNEKNYIYFQDFIPDNNCDIRVIVIGKKAFAIKRMIREDDFRSIMITSSTKTIPVIGALKIADIAAAEAAPRSRIVLIYGKLNNCAILEPIPAPVDTVGPSNPTEPPKPTVRELVRIEEYKL